MSKATLKARTPKAEKTDVLVDIGPLNDSLMRIGAEPVRRIVATKHIANFAEYWVAAFADDRTPEEVADRLADDFPDMSREKINQMVQDAYTAVCAPAPKRGRRSKAESTNGINASAATSDAPSKAGLIVDVASVVNEISRSVTSDHAGNAGASTGRGALNPDLKINPSAAPDADPVLRSEWHGQSDRITDGNSGLGHEHRDKHFNVRPDSGSVQLPHTGLNLHRHQARVPPSSNHLASVATADAMRRPDGIAERDVPDRSSSDHKSFFGTRIDNTQSSSALGNLQAESARPDPSNR